jgi:hypothetical protein
MNQPFDAAAFLAAVQAAAQAAPTPVTLPGVGACFKRELSVADVEGASAIRADLEKAGVDVTQGINIAIGLSQVLCGPDGTPIFDARNDAHRAMLAALPWSAVRQVMQEKSDGDDAAKNA